MPHRLMKSIIKVRRKVQTGTIMRSTMTMMPEETLKMKDGHGCKMRLRG